MRLAAGRDVSAARRVRRAEGRAWSIARSPSASSEPGNPVGQQFRPGGPFARQSTYRGDRPGRGCGLPLAARRDDAGHLHSADAVGDARRRRSRSACARPARRRSRSPAAYRRRSPRRTRASRVSSHSLTAQVDAALVAGAAARHRVGVLRRTRAAPRRARPLWRHVLCGHQPPHRDRHPDGPRRRTRAASSGWSCGVSPGSSWSASRWARDSALGDAVRRDAPLRSRSRATRRPCSLAAGLLAVIGVARRLGAGPPRRADRPDDRAARELSACGAGKRRSVGQGEQVTPPLTETPRPAAGVATIRASVRIVATRQPARCPPKSSPVAPSHPARKLVNY